MVVVRSNKLPASFVDCRYMEGIIDIRRQKVLSRNYPVILRQVRLDHRRAWIPWKVSDKSVLVLGRRKNGLVLVFGPAFTASLWSTSHLFFSWRGGLVWRAPAHNLGTWKLSGEREGARDHRWSAHRKCLSHVPSLAASHARRRHVNIRISTVIPIAYPSFDDKHPLLRFFELMTSNAFRYRNVHPRSAYQYFCRTESEALICKCLIVETIKYLGPTHMATTHRPAAQFPAPINIFPSIWLCRSLISLLFIHCYVPRKMTRLLRFSSNL